MKRSLMMAFLLLSCCALSGRAVGLSDEFERLARRYWSLLERRPQPGSVFDLWYRHYLQADRLDELESLIATRGQREEDVSAHLIAGLFFERRGRETQALHAYRQARDRDPADYRPSLRLAQFHKRHRDWSSAIEAFRETLALEVPERERPQIGLSLGRLLALGDRRDEALAVWRELAKRFPEDEDIQETLASTLAEEGFPGEAASLWRELRDGPDRDPDLRRRASVAIAEIHAQGGRPLKALSELDSLLDRLDSESWMAEEVREQIDGLFVSARERKRLERFYRERAEQNPSEIATLLAWARVCMSRGDGQAGLEVLDRAVLLAPSRLDIGRLRLEMLRREGRQEDAVNEARRLVDVHPRDESVRVALGELLLGQEEVASLDEALAVLSAISTLREDWQASTKAAETMARLAKEMGPGRPRATRALMKAAETHYRDAVLRSGHDPDAIETLGRFYFEHERTKEARETWETLGDVEGDGASLAHRVSMIYVAHELTSDALRWAKRAVERDPSRLDYRDHEIELLLEERLFDAAMASAEVMVSHATLGAEVAQSVQRRFEVCRTARREREELRRVRSMADPSWAQLWYGALLAEIEGDPAYSLECMARAREAQPDEPLLSRSHGEILERLGRLDAAIAVYEQLIRRGTRSVLEDAEKVIRLYGRRGDVATAKERALALLKTHPGHDTSYRLASEAAFLAGALDEGVAILEKAVAVFADRGDLVLELATALQRANRDREAVERYFMGLELARDLGEAVAIAERMAPLTEAHGQFDRLIHRLHAWRSREDEASTLARYLVELLVQRGRFREALAELRGILVKHPSDESLLRRGVAVAEEIDHYGDAIDYQRKVLELDPRDGDRARLDELYEKERRAIETQNAWRDLIASSWTPDVALARVDQKIGEGELEEAWQLTKLIAARFRDHWRVQHRAGVLLWSLGRLDRASLFLGDLIEQDVQGEDSRSPRASDSSGWDALPERRVLLLAQSTFERAADEDSWASTMSESLLLDPRQARVQAAALLAREASDTHRLEAWASRMKERAHKTPRLNMARAVGWFCLKKTRELYAVVDHWLEVEPKSALAHYLRLQCLTRVPWTVREGLSAQVSSSFQYLAERYPGARAELDLLEAELTWSQGGGTELAKPAVLRGLEGARDLSDLTRYVDLVTRMADPQLVERLMSRADILQERGGQDVEWTRALLRLRLAYGASIREILASFERYLAQRRAMAFEPSEDLVYPGPSVVLDAEGFEFLKGVYETLSREGEEGRLAQLLASKIQTVSSKDRPRYWVAETCVQWWRGDRDRALSSLSRLADSMERASSIRALRAAALWECGRAHAAMEELNRSRREAPTSLLKGVDALEYRVVSSLIEAGRVRVRATDGFLLAMRSERRGMDWGRVFSEADADLLEMLEEAGAASMLDDFHQTVTRKREREPYEAWLMAVSCAVLHRLGSHAWALQEADRWWKSRSLLNLPVHEGRWVALSCLEADPREGIGWTVAMATLAMEMSLLDRERLVEACWSAVRVEASRLEELWRVLLEWGECEEATRILVECLERGEEEWRSRAARLLLRHVEAEGEGGVWLDRLRELSAGG